MTDQRQQPEQWLAISQVIENAAALVQERLHKAPKPVLQMTNHLAETTGKGIRTVLLSHCAANLAGQSPASASQGAAAIELFHMATLVHDDVIDDAPTRRGKPSVQLRYGKKRAVICGDWLLCAAMNMAFSLPYEGETKQAQGLAAQYARTLEQICLGELQQGMQNGNLDLETAQYLGIVAKKTAALFVLSAHEGARLGQCSTEEARRLVRFARYLGIVFQIVDDVKDYAFHEQEILKPAQNDLQSGVVTLPLILAMRRNPGTRLLAQEVLGTGRAIDKLIDAVHQEDGVQASLTLANRYAQKAYATLDKLASPVKRDALSELMSRSLQAAKAFG